MTLVERAKGILLKPKEEWAVIDTEPATVGSLYSGYIIPLSAIPAVAMVIGWSVVGINVLGFRGRMPVGNALTQAAIFYVMGLIGVYVIGLIIDALAPQFGAQKSQIQALKVAAYSYTAAWVAGIFNILPSLSVLALIGALYSLYLFYLGLQIVMKSPPDKAVGYAVVVIGVAIIVYVVIGLVAAQFNPYRFPMT